jgi:hypothetical protein
LSGCPFWVFKSVRWKFFCFRFFSSAHLSTQATTSSNHGNHSNLDGTKAMPRRRQRGEAKKNKAMEAGWNLNTSNVKLPSYKGLYDPNLRHHFESRAVQQNLFKLGMIDREGRVLDIEKQKSKLFIIEQEFKAAEKAEMMRLREETDMRQRVQAKRHETLERGRRAEQLMKSKDDRRIRSEILRAAKGEVSAVPLPKKKTRRKKKSGSGGGRR